MPAFPMSYLAQLASPFTWARIKRDNEAARVELERLSVEVPT